MLRLKYPPSDARSIPWEHDVVRRVARRLPEAVAPIRARDGSTFFFFGADAAWLVRHVPGQTADRGDERHRVAAALDAGPLPPAWRARVAAQQRAALLFLDELASRELVHGVVHGDFFPGNVLLDGATTVGLIDWEEAQVAPLVAELAAAVWEFTKDARADDYDRAAAERFGRACRDAGGHVDAADGPIRPLHAKRVLEVLRAPFDRYVDWGYQKHNLRSAEGLA